MLNVQFMFAVGEHCMIVLTHCVTFVMLKDQMLLAVQGRGCAGISYYTRYNNNNIP